MRGLVRGFIIFLEQLFTLIFKIIESVWVSQPHILPNRHPSRHLTGALVGPSEQVEVLSSPSTPLVMTANIRVMVPDVDRFHGLALAKGHMLIRELSDKYYGLRDFTVAGPDGVGLRFASPIPGHVH